MAKPKVVREWKDGAAVSFHGPHNAWAQYDRRTQTGNFNVTLEDGRHV